MTHPTHQTQTQATTISATTPDLSRGELMGRLALFVGGVLVARLVFLIFLDPTTLVGDEAHYWEWSRRLDLSYYTKGPGIAWTIAAGTAILGNTEAGVRLLAPIASAIMSLAVAWATWRALGRRDAAWYAAVLAALAPVFLSLALLMTIDGPYAAIWALAMVAGISAVRPRDGPRAGVRQVAAFALLGLLVGIACLYKYTALLLLPGIILAWFVGAGRRMPLGRLALGLLACAVSLAFATLPITLWNAREGWPTVTHLLGHLHLSSGDRAVAPHVAGGYQPTWTLEFLATQVALAGPGLLLGGLAAWRAWRDRRKDPSRWRAASVLALCSLPMFVFYIGVSFFTEPQGNWALAGFLGFFALAGMELSNRLPIWRDRVRAWRSLPRPRPRAGVFRRQPETFEQACWHVALGLGIGAAIALPSLTWIARWPVVGPLVPVQRFTGADRAADNVRSIIEQVRTSTGLEPFVLSTHYGFASQLAFYLPGHPIVYCSQGFMPDGRTTQYDFFADTNLRDPAVAGPLRGRPAVILELWPHHDFSSVFDRIETVGPLQGRRPKDQPARVGFGFREFPSGKLPGPTSAPRDEEPADASGGTP